MLVLAILLLLQFLEVHQDLTAGFTFYCYVYCRVTVCDAYDLMAYMMD